MRFYKLFLAAVIALITASALCATPVTTKTNRRGPSVPTTPKVAETTFYMAPLGAEGEYGTAIYNEAGKLLNKNVAAIAIRQALNGQNKRVVIKVAEQPMVDPATKEVLTTAPPVQNANIWVGCYVLIIDWHSHYVGGCIQKNIRHLNIHVRNGCSNTGLFDLHVTGWREGRTPVLALYNSYSKWCNKVYFGWDNVKGMVYAASVGYVGYWGAVWISNALTPLIFAAVVI